MRSKKYIDWEQTRNEQGTWPTKVMVSLWFSNEANLLTRIGLLDVMREELKKGPYKQKGQVVSPRLELSPKRKPLAKEMKGDMCKIRWEAQLLQNTLLKEKVLQEKDGILSRKSLQESVHNSVNPFLGRCQLSLTNGSGSQSFS